MVRKSDSPKRFEAKPEESIVLLKKELRRRGMADAEIKDTLRKKKRRKPLEFAVVKSSHLLPMTKAEAAKPAYSRPASRIADELCTVDFAADVLKVHTKTILRFIRKGRLRATRIGKSYRIAKADLEAFAGVSVAAPADRASITSIVDVPDVGPQLAQKWSATITSALNARPRTGSPVRADIIYEAERGHLKIVVTGPPSETLNLLSLIRLWLDQLTA